MKISLLIILTLLTFCMSHKYSIDKNDKDLKSYLIRQKVPSKIIKELFDNLPEKTTPEADGYFSTEKSIFSINKPGSWFNLQENTGLLVIGFGPNGGPVAMDIKDNKGVIYYINHERMSSDIYTGVTIYN